MDGVVEFNRYSYVGRRPPRSDTRKRREEEAAQKHEALRDDFLDVLSDDLEHTRSEDVANRLVHVVVLHGLLPEVES